MGQRLAAPGVFRPVMYANVEKLETGATYSGPITRAIKRRLEIMAVSVGGIKAKVVFRPAGIVMDKAFVLGSERPPDDIESVGFFSNPKKKRLSFLFVDIFCFLLLYTKGL